MSESFSALLDESLSTLDMQPGSIVSGVVLDVDNDWVTVHVGLKSEGIISLDEFRNNEGKVEVNIGDEVEVALEAVEDGYGETRISREKARKISTWKMLEEALETVKVTINFGIFAVLYDLVRLSFNKIKPPSISKELETSFFFSRSKTFLKLLGSKLFFIGPTLPFLTFDFAEENFSTAFSKLAPAFNSTYNLLAISFAC